MLSRRRLRLPSVIIIITALGISAWLLLKPSTEIQPIEKLASRVTPESFVDASARKSTPAIKSPASETPDAAIDASSFPTLQPPEGSTAIDVILSNPSLDTITAARALGGLVQDQTLSQAERADALAHLLNLSAGKESELLLPLLKSPKLPDTLALTILSDALNSPLTWQADACLAVMARPTGKELRTEAQEHLAFLVDGDHGDDLNAWIVAARNMRSKWEASEQRHPGAQ